MLTVSKTDKKLRLWKDLKSKKREEHTKRMLVKKKSLVNNFNELLKEPSQESRVRG